MEYEGLETMEQFEFVAEDERFGQQARLMARLARHQMLAYEVELE